MTIAVERQARYLPATRLNRAALLAGGGVVRENWSPRAWSLVDARP